jgi:hypothetical protein
MYRLFALDRRTAAMMVKMPPTTKKPMAARIRTIRPITPVRAWPGKSEMACPEPWQRTTYVPAEVVVRRDTGRVLTKSLSSR